MVKINLKTITTEFKSILGSSVTIREVMTAGDFDRISAVDEKQFLFEALTAMIIDWNLEDDNGVKLPINRDSLKLLPLVDLQELFYKTDFGKKAKELEVKKN